MFGELLEEELLLESLPPVVCNEVFIAPLFPLTENIFCISKHDPGVPAKAVLNNPN